ncbi:MAG: FadR/GntR family transcriptional regulator [Nakamurella sp.]
MHEVMTGAPFHRDRTRASDQISADLRLQILSGRLPRGTRLPSEKELAAHYAVSTPTVREALGALGAMSLIEVRHGSGAFVIAEPGKLLTSAMKAVVQLENVDLLSILEVSEALYIKALQLAAANATPDDLSTLRAAADRFEPGATEPDFSGALSAFLRALVGISHNALLINLSGFLIDSHITLAEKVATRPPSAWVNVAGVLKAERSAIVEALEKNDTPAAETALLAYTQHAKDLVSRLVTDRPDEIAATS